MRNLLIVVGVVGALSAGGTASAKECRGPMANYALAKQDFLDAIMEMRPHIREMRNIKKRSARASSLAEHREMVRDHFRRDLPGLLRTLAGAISAADAMIERADLAFVCQRPTG